jgi:hypothetical protein
VPILTAGHVYPMMLTLEDGRVVEVCEEVAVRCLCFHNGKVRSCTLLPLCYELDLVQPKFLA